MPPEEGRIETSEWYQTPCVKGSLYQYVNMDGVFRTVPGTNKQKQTKQTKCIIRIRARRTFSKSSLVWGPALGRPLDSMIAHKWAPRFGNLSCMAASCAWLAGRQAFTWWPSPTGGTWHVCTRAGEDEAGTGRGGAPGRGVEPKKLHTSFLFFFLIVLIHV